MVNMICMMTRVKRGRREEKRMIPVGVCRWKGAPNIHRESSVSVVRNVESMWHHEKTTGRESTKKAYNQGHPKWARTGMYFDGRAQIPGRYVEEYCSGEEGDSSMPIPRMACIVG
jgi:hypothetical protein